MKKLLMLLLFIAGTSNAIACANIAGLYMGASRKHSMGSSMGETKRL